MLNKIMCLLLSASFISCASTTVINSMPQGGKLYVDGMYLGKTPFTYSDTKIVGATTMIKISKEGCENFTGFMTRSEHFEVGACIGGVLVLVPFLWVMGYNPTRTYELECGKQSEVSVKTNILIAYADFKKQNRSSCQSPVAI